MPKESEQGKPRPCRLLVYIGVREGDKKLHHAYLAVGDDWQERDFPVDPLPRLAEEAIEKLFERYADIGLRGSKIDFFDRLRDGKHTTADYEDTRMGLRVRDRICRIAARHRIQLVFHGCAIPTGERRRWPHVLGTEAIKGQEASPGPRADPGRRRTGSVELRTQLRPRLVLLSRGSLPDCRRIVDGRTDRPYPVGGSIGCVP